MKIQRYVAKDMRSALAQVREALGPDAVILSSGRVGDEVEVVAAIDFESQRETSSRTRLPRAARRRSAHEPVRSVDFAKAKRASLAAVAGSRRSSARTKTTRRPRAARRRRELARR